MIDEKIEGQEIEGQGIEGQETKAQETDEPSRAIQPGSVTR
jgi:hypothetical protein